MSGFSSSATPNSAVAAPCIRFTSSTGTTSTSGPADAGTRKFASSIDRSSLTVCGRSSSSVGAGKRPWTAASTDFSGANNPDCIPAVSEKDEEEETLVTSDHDCDRMDDDTEEPVQKRTRYSSSHHPEQRWTPSTLSAAASLIRQRIEEHSTVQDSVAEQQVQQQQQVAAPVEWWKQHPRKTQVEARRATVAADIPVCHVCQKPCNSSSISAVVNKNNSKTLWAYFAPANGIKDSRYSPKMQQPQHAAIHRPSATTAATSLPPPAPQQHAFSCCTFCERSDICERCWQNCEECELPFCTFCRTTDDEMRHVCLDCCAASRRENNNFQHHNSLVDNDER